MKTAGQTGKGYRVCPIFTPLRPHLEDAHELAEPGTVYVVSGSMADNIRAKMDGPNGSNDANTRTAFLKLIKRAGLEPWPRLFHTLRASAETDLLEQGFPMNAVTEWLGHSAVSLKHYARVPDHLFSLAAGGGAESGARAAQNQAQAGADGTGREKRNATETLTEKDFRRVLSGQGLSRPNDQMTPRGFDTADESAEKLGTSTIPPQQSLQIPVQSPQIGPLAAFVASLTPEQRVKFTTLLGGG